MAPSKKDNEATKDSTTTSALNGQQCCAGRPYPLGPDMVSKYVLTGRKITNLNSPPSMVSSDVPTGAFYCTGQLHCTCLATCQGGSKHVLPGLLRTATYVIIC
eukprot:12428532-Karenia_brevis.AAC.1